jgi:uncharacterized protein (TIGR02001 family)
MTPATFFRSEMFWCQAVMAAGAMFPMMAQADAVTGHIDLVSKYYLRGITNTYGNGDPLGNKLADAPESDRPAVQWGVDYAPATGFYAGYWASTINYSYKQLGNSYRDRTISDFQRDKSIENDLYGGYVAQFGELKLNVGLTYYYLNGTAANAPETKLSLSQGPFTFMAQTLLRDVVWGNSGDTYWTAAYTQALPYDLTLTSTLGFYTYQREGRYVGSRDTATGTACQPGEAFIVNGCFAGGSLKSSAFRHLILGLSQPIGSTGLTWGAQLIVGSQNRFGVNQGTRLAGSLSYGF